MDRTSLVPPMPEMWQFPVAGVVPAPVRAGGGRRVGRMGANAATDESAMTEQSGRSGGSKAATAAGRRKRKDCSADTTGGASEDESSKLASTSSGHDLTDYEGTKCLKVLKSTDESGNIKTEMEANLGMHDKLTIHSPNSESQKQDYIHVRARRGQATDSHSLAERARREKISERMRILQDLVPGCNKVTGKASVLDEIINYIQALHHQVEFLSMKLEAVTSRINSGIELFPPKDFVAQAYDITSSLALSSQATREFEQGSAAEWLHMQVGGAFERVT